MLSLFQTQTPRGTLPRPAVDEEVKPLTPRPAVTPASAVVLSFDVEEHFRIEAANGLPVADDLAEHCRLRVDVVTRRLLDLLASHRVRATFFVVGQLARDNPTLVRAMAEAGHEVASHGWDHRRLHRLDADSFREDLRLSKDALEQASGQAVCGYRAPTFSVTRQTAWGLDVLAEEGFTYDSSIYPVRHDRYGVPTAPRGPFVALGRERSILELPPVTLRLAGMNAPMGGGGYFRLFPLSLTQWAIRQTLATATPPIAMLYFHPWEFDPQQQRLALGRLARMRTYVGITRTTARLETLLRSQVPFRTAHEVATDLLSGSQTLPSFRLSP